MPTDHRRELARIKRFDQLVAYLRDEMGWPIEGDDFEDLTFDYTPDELGIDAANAAKIQEIKRLRPLTADQPWGIFFVKFEPKRLPVVALRRILSRVVLKKRAAANSVERAAWDMADLLFISNYGDDTERRMSFAHFVQDDDWGDLPTLKILGWDGDDTNLHLDHVARELTTKLRWPDDEADITSWRDAWASAFTLRNREVITTAKHLAERLAGLARETRRKANAALAIESSTGPLRTLMDAFKKALLHDLDDDGFADMYAQTIAYGLLSARISRPAGLTADNMADMVPVTNPFLKEMLESFLRLGGRRRRGDGWTGIDFDELGINEIVQLLREANIEAVLRDFGDRNPEEDPVIHFYESFLKEYDAKKRMQRGVFYTPRPVVSYIVRSVHELLQTEFGLADGLADTTTWGEMLEKHPGLKLPLLSDSPGETQTISPDEPFVQILDPATGTATFLVEVIDVIYATMTAKWKRQGLTEAQQIEAWNDYVPKHLLPRLHAYELMMAPYAIAHMKIGLKLAETGYRFESEERARIYLTNALEPWVKQLSLIGFDALAHEATAVNEIKRQKRFTVVIGNPPYAAASSNPSTLSDGKLTHIGQLMRSYYELDGVPLGERNPRWLQDDYVKFIRLAQHILGQVPFGILGFITNHGYLGNPTFRGMRQQLLRSFSEIAILDLHGNSKRQEKSPDGSVDDNVFDIQQGVAISFFTRKQGSIKSEAEVVHENLWGTRASKYNLLASQQKSVIEYNRVCPIPPFYLFLPQDADLQSQYGAFWSIRDIFPVNNTGIITKRDALTLHWTEDAVWNTVHRFSSLDPSEARIEFDLPEDVRDWKIEWAQKDLLKTGLDRSRIKPVAYRPFDTRFTYYTGNARGFIGWPVEKVMRHMVAGRNYGLISARSNKSATMDHFFVTRLMMETKCGERTTQSCIFPLYLQPEVDVFDPHAERRTNISPEFFRALDELLHTTRRQQGQEDDSTRTIEPEDILHYAYGVFHSPGYRSRYGEFLKIDFPRLPLIGNLRLFRTLGQLGGDLVALHLLESATLDYPITEFIGSGNPEVEKPSWGQDTVWLDKRQTTGFKGVPEAVWTFHIGGYQVCHKWLKDRKGRTLSDEDITHYQKIVVALSETIRLMREIDEVIDQHGGWPGAFAASNAGGVGDTAQ